MPKMFQRQSRRLGFAFFICISFLFLAEPSLLAQDLGWKPQRTWVFIVGTLEWQQSDVLKPFPVKNRREALLADFSQSQGVPSEQMVYLQDRKATLRQVRSAFAALLPKAREGDLLFFYYCGHGYKSK